MMYDQGALKRLVKSIGMDKPLGYMIEGRGSEKVYVSLGGEKKEKGHYYSLVAEAISDVINTDEFKSKAKPARRVKTDGDISILQTRKKRFPDMRDDWRRENLSGYEISVFKRIYGLGCFRDDYETLSKKLDIPVNEIKLISNRIRKILRNGKNTERPGEYRAEVWRIFHEKLRKNNLGISD